MEDTLKNLQDGLAGVYETFEDLRISLPTKTINSGGCAWLIKKSKNKITNDYKYSRSNPETSGTYQWY
mgnify:CR=1 FL=1